jgi:hypothetical protein
MSITPLSNIEEYLERTVFHTIRQEIIDKGYLPNILQYPQTAIGYNAYNAAVTAITNSSKKFAIEIFNSASPEARGTKKVPRIVIDSQGFIPGELGGDLSRFYYFDTINNVYYGKIRPTQTSNFQFNIRLIALTIEQIRVMNAIVALSLPRRGYIPLYNFTPTQKVFTRYIGNVQVLGEQEGIIEQIYKYEIPDVWEIEDTTIPHNIAPIGQITLQMIVEDDSVSSNTIIQ